MNLIVILDGVAEDLISDIPTTLELASTPFLDRVARQSTCGLFDPHDPLTQIVKTDLIVASLLGIRPTTWPGRAYFEVVDTDPAHTPPAACAFIRYRWVTSEPRSITSWLKEATRSIHALAQSCQVLLALRSNERTVSTHLVWVPSGECDIHMAAKRITVFHNQLHDILPTNIQIELDETWHGRYPIEVEQFRTQPCFLAYAHGSLPGLCRTAGIEIIPGKAHPFDTNHQIYLFEQLQQIIATNHHRFGVLYYKAPDWASHAGNRVLKMHLIEFIDYWLGQLLGHLLNQSGHSLLIVSDHRTNIGADHSSESPSLFMLFPGKNSSSSFCERGIEAKWVQPPLTLGRLHGIFFGT